MRWKRSGGEDWASGLDAYLVKRVFARVHAQKKAEGKALDAELLQKTKVILEAQGRICPKAVADLNKMTLSRGSQEERAQVRR